MLFLHNKIKQNETKHQRMGSVYVSSGTHRQCHHTGLRVFLLTEDIGAGPLTYIGEALSAALGIFGVAAYFVNQVSQFKTEIRQQLEQMRKEAERETDENKQ